MMGHIYIPCILVDVASKITSVRETLGAHKIWKNSDEKLVEWIASVQNKCIEFGEDWNHDQQNRSRLIASGKEGHCRSVHTDIDYISY